MLCTSDCAGQFACNSVSGLFLRTPLMDRSPLQIYKAAHTCSPDNFSEMLLGRAIRSLLRVCMGIPEFLPTILWQHWLADPSVSLSVPLPFTFLRFPKNLEPVDP